MHQIAMKMFSVICACLLATLASCGNSGAGRRSGNDIPKKQAQIYTYQVVAAYPHLTTSYTQGLQYTDGVMWEGTGEYGRSRLQTIDLGTGRAEVVAELPASEFGEGITLLGDRIYQLTWTNRTVHVYDRKSGRELHRLRYEGEGWGLTTDGQRLYMSDGSSVIRILDPETFEQTGRISVTCNGVSVPYLNELEWIDGRIWANVYTLAQIVIINPADGIVEGIVDLTGLLSPEETSASTDVLNGIAYDAVNDRIFVTGKNWSRIFEIRILPK